jgi:hypothetical protein
MNEVRELLALPLEKDNGHLLRSQLADIERHSAYVSQEYRKAEEILADMRGKVYDPSGRTELERKVAMERQTREYQRLTDEWGDLAKLIAQRLSMGQSFLRDMQNELTSGLRSI